MPVNALIDGGSTKFRTGGDLILISVHRGVCCRRRLVSNIELLDEQASGDIAAASNSLVFESSLRDDTIWAARNEYRLRYVDGELRMAYKKVILVNNEKALFTLSFLI